MLDAKNLGYSVGNKWLVRNINYTFLPGKIYMICGPNGAGKSTLLKLLSTQLEPKEGTIFYNGKPTDQRSKHSYARFRGVLSQQVDISFALPVSEVIMMGRYPHFETTPSMSDHNICEEVVKKLGLENLMDRNFLTLSGGEKQRVQFARVLAQIWHSDTTAGNRFLLLDEPISALDIRYQFEFLQHVKDIIDNKTVVIAILHDLNLVLNYADEVLLMEKGILFSSGKPSLALKNDHIERVFNIKTDLYNLQNIDLMWPSRK